MRSPKKKQNPLASNEKRLTWSFGLWSFYYKCWTFPEHLNIFGFTCNMSKVQQVSVQSICLWSYTITSLTSVTYITTMIFVVVFFNSKVVCQYGHQNWSWPPHPPAAQRRRRSLSGFRLWLWDTDSTLWFGSISVPITHLYISRYILYHPISVATDP